MVGNLLLVRARVDQVSTWVGKGLVAAHVTPLGDWTAVTPARRHIRFTAFRIAPVSVGSSDGGAVRRRRTFLWPMPNLRLTAFTD